MRRGRIALALWVAIAGGGACARSGAPAPAAAPQAHADDVAALLDYIHRGWTKLRRSHRDLLAAARDPKVKEPGPRWPVYVARDEDLPAIERLLAVEVPPAEWAQLALQPLPDHEPPPGLLYVPRPYVVPGGRFNEVYGWDSYFIEVGLLRDGALAAARDLVEDLLYEVDRYGYVLNANRSYYLTRSQPPLLSRMVLELFARTHERALLDRAWPALVKYHRYWTTPPHLTPETGLSRYHDAGHGPSIEVIEGEKDAFGRDHYARVREYFRTHDVTDYDETRFYDAEHDRLTPEFYVADRSMRESGFDPSGRFGPFNAGVLDYDPVCLNSFLYVMEKDLAEIATSLHHAAAAADYRSRAERRAATMNALLWDEAEGLYLDYDFVRKRRRDYPFATTFFPLWAGLATPAQAARVAARLPLFERPGGLVTSTHRSGDQWDAPFGWAPLHLLAVKGLRRYGYDADADRIAVRFLSLVLEQFLEHGSVFEKYDVEKRSSSVAAGLRFGYTSNEIGFGWTNATFSELYAELPVEARARVRRLGDAPAAPGASALWSPSPAAAPWPAPPARAATPLPRR